MIEELGKSIPKKKSYHKYNESMKPLRPILSKSHKPILRHRVTTMKENLHALEKEMNKNEKKNLFPKGTKI